MAANVIKMSVRDLVEFILRSGDIDNRRTDSMTKNAMAEGSRIHRKIQNRMGANYRAEVPLKISMEYTDYEICLEGRADGIITEEDTIVIDEIKSMYADVNRLKEPVPVHLAQAMCYAYIYCRQQGLKEIDVQLTYCNIETEAVRRFRETHSYEDLEVWFESVISQYLVWAEFITKERKLRQESIVNLEFPFEYREGQRNIVVSVYKAVKQRRNMFIQAPTGVGKTISTIFPAVRAVGEEAADKIFYLTAKTITRTVAEEAFRTLRKTGLHFKTVTITAKDKICSCEKTECNPLACPRAKGHYDRINGAVFDVISSESDINREVIERYAEQYNVCPFEMSLDISSFMDGIICDYNYVFDPYVCLKRYFSEGVQGSYIFLVDEAHNLVERGRDMYSAVLCKEDFLELKRTVKAYDERIAGNLDKCNRELLSLKRACDGCRIEESIESFMRTLIRLRTAIEDYLEDHEDSPVRKEILAFYFEVSHFMDMYELLDESYVTYTQMREDGSFIVRLFCVNPAKNLRNCMMRGRSTILFSATFLPIQYYKKLLGAQEGDYEVYARSVFQPEKMGLYIGRDVTSRFTRRGDEEYYRIASYIHNVIEKRHGNYLLFFPSHAFLRRVYEIYQDYFNEDESVECILQEDHMDEEAREAFLNRFIGNEACDLRALIRMDIEIEEERSLLGFCVMGGIFGEGIDLKNDSLIGAIIVGTGLPQVCDEREILKKYFDGWGENGFDYAYRYPGMNKVLQAAGRVIRTVEDFGIVALLDERFLSPAYQRLFPREWQEYEIVTVDQIGRKVERFWDEWL